MTITVDGIDYASHEVIDVKGCHHLVVDMGPVTAPIVNGVEFPQYEYRVIDGQSTLSIPLGERATEPAQTPPTFDFDDDEPDHIDLGFDRILGELDARTSKRAHPPQEHTATIVDISEARLRAPHPSRRPKVGGPSRTHFTPRPLG